MKLKPGILLIVSVFVLFTAVFFVLIPLIHPGFYVSDDGAWMVIRLSAFFQSLREGQFPVRFLGRLNYSYGYPVADFLYPGFLYIGSLIHLIGLPFVTSVKTILGGSVLIGALFTFLWLKQYFKTVSSLFGTLCFVSAPYLLFDLYTRGSVGEVLALSWAAMGLYSIASKKPWLLALSVSLVIVSHNSLALLFIGFFAFYITVLRQWRKFWLMFLLGIGMVMFFWFPALYERKYVVFDAVRVSNPTAYFVTVSNMMLLGFSGVLGACISLVMNKLNAERKFFLITFIVTLFMVLPVSGFLWQSSLLTHIFQFPYRLLSISVLIGSWFVAYVLEYQKVTRIPLIIIFAAIGVWSVLSSIQKIQYTDLPEGYYTTNEATTTVANEYMPRWASELPSQRAYQKLIFTDGAGTFDIKTITTQSINAVVHTTQDSVVQINTLYYPGWGVTLDGAPVLINYKNNMGLIRISVPKGDHHLTAGFRETISRFLADILSLGFLIWYGLAVIIQKRHK